jgi:hypothetical protein
MDTDFYNHGQSLIGIVIVLVIVGLMAGGLYFYLSKQLPEVPEITEKAIEEKVIEPEEEMPEEIIAEEKIGEEPVKEVEPKVTEPKVTEPKVTEPKVTEPEIVKGEFSEGCTTIFNNGSPNKKINIYFYEDGFNSNMQDYEDFVLENVAIVFGGTFEGKTYPGVEPFKSLKQEFNIFSYQDENDDCNSYCSFSQKVYPDLRQSCSEFVAAGAFGTDEGNYNIFIFPKFQGQDVTGSSRDRLNSTTLRLTSQYSISINVNSFNESSLPHELGHRIGFFDEEYSFYDLYLGAKTIHPNIDSFSCTKWCQGVNTQSACYTKYIQWLDCFKTRIINESSEIQDILEDNNLDYTHDNYGWWGTCFNSKNINICGDKIRTVVESYIRKPDERWVSDWDYCKSRYLEAPGYNSCDLGLNCGEGKGCYVGESFSRFLPSRENQYIMGRDTRTNDRFNKHDEEILRYNILNKIRYIDVENIE